MRIRGRTLGAGLTIGLVILAAMAVLAVVAPMIWADAAADTTGPLRAGPSAEHWLGTDAHGRDVLLRTLVAARLSLLMAIAATAIAVLIGGLLGAAVALSGPRLTWWGTRLIELLIAWPPIIIALAVTAIMRPGTTAVVLAVGLAFSPQFARLTFTLANSVTARDYTVTARMLGVPAPLLLIRHVLPGIGSALLVLMSSALASSLVSMSGLSFIGLGVQAPEYDWGTMLAAGLKSIYSSPAEFVGPALGIVLTGLAAGLVGDGLARLNDPRLRGTGRRVARTRPRLTAQPAHMPGDDVAVIEGLRIATTSVPAKELVHGVSFSVAQGEIVGIVGESGSGKSLTAMTAAQLTPDGLGWTADRLAIAGHELGPDVIAPTDLALKVGVVFQDPTSCFNPARKLGPQLIESIRFHQGLSRAEARRIAVERLREVRISEPEKRLRQYPHELSGGMRQRAMIAMSILTEPRLLIADEPTTALDVTVQAEVLRILRQVNRTHGTAILLISHDIDVVAAMCDRVLVMRDGEVVEEITVADLRAGRTAHPYTRQLLDASLRERRASVGAEDE
ncbi:ATP-binding cassette domain-containing protein [Microbacterium sp. NPDC055357]